MQFGVEDLLQEERPGNDREMGSKGNLLVSDDQFNDSEGGQCGRMFLYRETPSKGWSLNPYDPGTA